MQQSAVHSEKLSQGNSEISTSTASASATEEASLGQDIVIPVQVEASAETGKNLNTAEQTIAVEKDANLNDEKDDHKKTTASKDCAIGDNTEVDAVHKQLEEEGEEDDSKSGMAALRKLLEEDESYIKHKNRTIPIDSKGVFFEDRDFSDWQQCFHSAVKDVLNKFHEPSSAEGDLAAYRGLRQRDLKLENQAAYVDENLHAHTVSTFSLCDFH